MTALVSMEQPGRVFFWTAPVSDGSELATEDPLALDYVAQQVGLLLLPALTTRSTRAQAFAMVVYGLSLAERAIAHHGYAATDEVRRELFERWERFWALATLEHRQGDLPRGDRDTMRGVRGARAAYHRGDGPLPLDFQLISRQQELGNLGAYLAPLRRSGLVIEGTVRPSPAALDIIDALASAQRDDKTLIFCTRVESLRELKREIEATWVDRLVARWQRAFPDATREDIFEHQVGGKSVDGRHSRLRDRFNRAQDALYLVLRERYAVTLLDATDFATERLDAVVTRANEILGRQRVSKSQAERVDWSLLKRSVEQATAMLLREEGQTGESDPTALEHLTDERYVPFGYDLVADDVEDFAQGDRVPQWTIHTDDARLVLRREHLWAYLKSAFVEIPPELRVRTVERIAGYLVSRHVPFLPDLLAYAKGEGLDVSAVEARALLPLADRFWTKPSGRPWCDLLRRYLTYAGKLGEKQRREVLDDVVRADSIVRHTVEGESRERLREAFNTPLYPMILVANEVMQEGLDLHHHCRRVVHHDLAWNPAQLEQRVGRVDRLGSLVQQLRQKRPETTLDVLLPLVANTIDERLERTVRLRERWLEVLLGAPPKIDEYGLADDPVQPLPAAFAEALRVELGPGDTAARVPMVQQVLPGESAPAHVA